MTEPPVGPKSAATSLPATCLPKLERAARIVLGDGGGDVGRLVVNGDAVAHVARAARYERDGAGVLHDVDRLRLEVDLVRV